MSNNQKPISQEERFKRILDLLSDVQTEASMLHNGLAQLLSAAESHDCVGSLVDGDDLRALVSASRSFCDSILACRSGVLLRQSICGAHARPLAPLTRPARRRRTARISA